MDPLAVLLRVVLLPAAVTVATALVARVVARTGHDGAKARLRDGIVTIGAAAAFLSALLALGVRPSLPLASSEDAWTWVFWYAVAGAVLGIAGCFGPRSRPLRFLLHAATGAGLAWMMARMFPSVAPTAAVLRSAVAGVAAASLATAFEARAEGGGRGPVALAVVVAALGSAAAMFRNGGFLLLSLATVGFATSIATTAALARARGGLALPAPLAPFVSLVLIGLLHAAYAHSNFGEVVGFPLGAALLLAASAGCAAMSRPRLAIAASVAFGLAALIVAASLGTTANRWVE